MKVNIDFAQFIDVIEFTPFMGEDIELYQKSFEEWYYELKTDEDGCSGYQQREDLPYTFFDSQAVIDWLNETSPNCNARVIQKRLVPGTQDKTLKCMCF